MDGSRTRRSSSTTTTKSHSSRNRSRKSSAAHSHREAYARALDKAPLHADGDGPKLWRGARENANLFKTALTLGDGACKCRRGAPGCPVHGKETNPFATPEQLRELSTKILALVEKIDAHPAHKHFVFTRYRWRVLSCVLSHKGNTHPWNWSSKRGLRAMPLLRNGSNGAKRRPRTSLSRKSSASVDLAS